MRFQLSRSTRAAQGGSVEPVAGQAIDALPQDRRERIRELAAHVGQVSLSDAVFTSGTQEEPALAQD